ncbi:MAG: AmmeMemoRadiSam system radical SAM enzyme, partial [Lentisphaerae bacterium]|nr:AmmeMemoRadiSam system radical SAM enzyme [Lentisphaerota bacterium]
MMNHINVPVSRRDFIRAAGMAAAGLSTGNALAQLPSAPELREAAYYEQLGNNDIQCTLCPWQCIVKNGERGNCNVRENRNGRYYTLVYGQPCAINNDPIEKKPFFHVYPRSKALSIATVGCNMQCSFCQNWDISQSKPESVRVQFQTPEAIVQMAMANKSRTIAYTYNEPTVFFEYMVDCAKAAKAASIGNVMVSNGFINAKPMKELCSLMTAVKIDLKAFSQQFYGRVCHGRLQPVLDTLKLLADSGVWFEIVVLIIPTLNDSS